MGLGNNLMMDSYDDNNIMDYDMLESSDDFPFGSIGWNFQQLTRNLLFADSANCCESGTTNGFTKSGSLAYSVNSDAQYVVQGSKSLKVDFAVNGDLFQTQTFRAKPSTVYSMSFYMKIPTGKHVSVQMVWNNNSGSYQSNTNIDCTGDGTLKLYKHENLTSHASNYQTYIKFTNTDLGADTVYVDKIMFNEGTTVLSWEEGIGDIQSFSPTLGSPASMIRGTSTAIENSDPALMQKGMWFDGVDDRLNVAAANGLPINYFPNTTAMSFATLMYVTTNAASKQIFGCAINGTSDAFSCRIDSGNTITLGGRSVTADSYQTLSTITTLTDNTWYVISGTIDLTAKTITIYINGVLNRTAGSKTFAQYYFSVGTPTGPDAIGMNSASTNPYLGMINSLYIGKNWTDLDHMKTYNAIKIKAAQVGITV